MILSQDKKWLKMQKRKLDSKFPLGILYILSSFILVGCEEEVGFSCPSGTEMVGSPPPKGSHTLCGKTNYGVFIKHGPAKFFYEDGSVKEEGSYEENRKTGDWVCYTRKGLPIKQQWEITKKKRVKSTAELDNEKRNKSKVLPEKEEPEIIKSVMKKGDPCPWEPGYEKK